MGNIPKPQTGSRYIKLPKPGQSIKLRILSPFIEFYEAWKDNKPVRKLHAKEFGPLDYDKLDKQGKPQGPKYNMAGAAWQYDGENSKVGVLQIKQATVMTGFYDLDNNPEWGPITDYDIIIKAADDGKSYSVLPCPKKELASEIQVAWDGVTAFGSFDLRELLRGGDPFNPQTANVRPKQDADIPF